MNSSFALTSYLWTEVRTRWWTQPASPLARLALTFTLTGTAAVFLVGFAAAEQAQRRELQRLGFDTIVWRAPAAAALSEISPLPVDHWARSLAARGDLTALQQLPAPAMTSWGQGLPVLAAPLRVIAAGMAAVARDEPAGSRAADGAPAGSLWFTRTLPPGRRVPVQFQGATLTALTAVPAGSWQALGLDEFLIVPAGEAGVASPAGRMDVVLFTPKDEAVAEAVGRDVRALFAAEGIDPPVTQDPLPLRRAAAAFARLQARWRGTMLLVLGGCVLLMFASLGMLEERQTRFTQALLRSLGVPARRLWVAAWVENALLANAAFLGAVAIAQVGAMRLLPLVGFTGGAAGFLPREAVIGLACAVNAGVLLSLFPLARALRRPVGIVLP